MLSKQSSKAWLTRCSLPAVGGSLFVVLYLLCFLFPFLFLFISFYFFLFPFFSFLLSCPPFLFPLAVGLVTSDFVFAFLSLFQSCTSVLSRIPLYRRFGGAGRAGAEGVLLFHSDPPLVNACYNYYQQILAETTLLHYSYPGAFAAHSHSLTLALTLTHSHTHTLTHSHIHTFTHLHPHTPAHMHTLTHSHIHTTISAGLWFGTRFLSMLIPPAMFPSFAFFPHTHECASAPLGMNGRYYTTDGSGSE